MKTTSFALASLLTFVPFTAFAISLDGTVTTGATVGASNTVVGVNANAQLSVEARAKERANQEIDRRVAQLNQVRTRIDAMAKLSTDEKSQLQTTIDGQVSALTDLKAKIAAETEVAALKSDVQAITKNYRIYMLVIPQAHIVASADRIQTITDQMQTLGAKLDARISASGDTKLQSSYADMQTKVADAESQASAALSTTIHLSPDNGDTAINASNAAALKSARAEIVAATQDLAAARADIAIILAGLKAHSSTSASASATTE